MPEFYYIEDLNGVRKIGLWQTPTSSTWPIAIWGVKKPTDLAVNADTLDLDDRLGKAVVYKVCQDVEDMRREQGLSRYFEQKCEDEIQKYMTSGMDTNEKVEFLRTARPSD